MTHRRCFAIPAALAFLLAAAACDSDPLGPPDADLALDSFDIALSKAEGTRGERPGGGGGGVPLFDELAALIPGFGGMYRTARCAVVVVLTADADREQALVVVRRKLAPLMGDACAGGVRLSAQAGEFTYTELRRYLAAAQPIVGMRGVDAVRIDFALNRLVVSVASRSVIEAATERLRSVGVPSRVVVFQLTGQR